MPNQDIVAVLKQFNENTNTLMNLDFINLLLTTKPGLTVAAEDERSGPDSKAIDVFVQTFAFFMPDGDESLFKAMSEVYGTLKGFDKKRDSFEKVKDNINAFLDSPVNMAVGGSYSKREIMQIFVYGVLAGVNADKKNTYEKWIAEDITEAIITNRFIGILVKVFESITKVRRINEAVLTRLSS